MRASARRFSAVVRATVVELCGEPFVFLTLLAALALTVLAPACHFHQFGEVSRLARDAGFSGFLLGSSIALVFGAIRSVRREVESGTCEAALAHAISPGAFLAAKTVGFIFTGMLFLLSQFALTLVMVDGMEVGAAVAARSGNLARPWGVSLALGTSVLILPAVLAAALNRFGGRRFILAATVLTAAFAFADLGFLLVRGRSALVLRYLPAFLLAALPVFLLTVAAAVLSFRHRANVAAAGTALFAAILLPALGNYCVAEALTAGGHLSLRYLGLAFAAAIPIFVTLLALGDCSLSRQSDNLS